MHFILKPTASYTDLLFAIQATLTKDHLLIVHIQFCAELDINNTIALAIKLFIKLNRGALFSAVETEISLEIIVDIVIVSIGRRWWNGPRVVLAPD